MLIHAPTKSVLLNVPDPFLVRDLLPLSRLLPHADYNVAVKHTVESTKVLRNIGFDVPAPIQSQYRWPGKYTPMAHQRVMAEMKTLHRRMFDLSEMGCVDAATEYLSPTGWRRIDQYISGPVAQYVPERGAIEMVEPTEYVKLPCPEMIRFKTTRGVDQLLSPEHRVLYVRPDGSTTVTSAEAVEGAYDRMPMREVRFITTYRTTSTTALPLTEAQMRVQVMVNADGSQTKTPHRVVVRVKKQRKIDRCRQLLTAAGISWTEGPSGDHTTFRFTPPEKKHAYAHWWGASQAQLEIVADEIWRWDGSLRKRNSVSFSSHDESAADFAQHALSASGRRALKACSTRERRGKSETEYRVFASAGSPLVGLAGKTTEGARIRNVWREPSTDGFKYCFMVPSTFLLLRRNGCVFATGNTGKTASTLWAADYLMSLGRVNKALILSPLSTLERVWKNDIFDVLMHRVAAVVHGTLEKRLAALANRSADFYILNHDGVTIRQVAEAIRKREDIDLVIVDEASMFRNHDTKKFKALERMLRDDQRLWLLTGTPCPNAPTDSWALARLVSPGRVPKFFGAFKRATMAQVTSFKWVPRPDAYTTAYNAMQPAVRFKKADCLDLPPVVTMDRQAEMSKEQRDAFNEMKNVMQTETKSGMQITAVNAADKINKIRQILCGSVKDPKTDTYVSLPHAPRTSVLLEAIESASAKVLVVVPFKGIIQSLEKEIGKHYSVAVLNGDVTPKARDAIILDFKTQADPHVLLCHPKVMAHGLNLTEADTLIFYAPIYSNDEAQQVVERFNRAGQTRKMTVIRIAAHPLEWEIYKLLDTRRATQEGILSLYRSITG